MKKNIFLLSIFLAFPALVLPAADEGITITKLSVRPVPFNERRDPAADSPYNAFDGDVKTAALYSDFTVEFSKPVAIDQVKIMNGNVSGDDTFKRDNRARDIEITLYTVAYKPDMPGGKRGVKIKTVKPGVKTEKKHPVKEQDSKGKSEQEKTEKEKPGKDKKEKEEKKTVTPEKVVTRDEYDTIYNVQHEGAQLFLTASETVVEDSKTETVRPGTVKKDKSGKPEKIKAAAKKSSQKKKAAGKEKTHSGNENIIEITDSKGMSKKSDEHVLTGSEEVKKDKKKTGEAVKKDPVPVNKKIPDKKSFKPETITVRPSAKEKGTNKDQKKNDNTKTADLKPVDDVKVNKMTGIVRIEDDKAGRVLVYASLKDSAGFQSIDLKGEYSVTKMDFRTRDDEYYAGSMPDRSGITEISLFNNGKSVAIQGIDALKKSYIEKYSKYLADSLADETFIMYENSEVVLRMKFRKNGRMEFFDRFKCGKKGDADCTYLSMPDMWRVTDGKLMMRYHTIWRIWKYELDSQNDMLSDNEQPEPPRWMKLYFKTDTGFSEQYLELYRSEKSIWTDQ